jgi:predicted RNA polymerase sigma factor
VWKFRGVPDNPSVWLMTTARNRAIDRLANYPFYAATLGELELRRGRHEIAAAHFQAAMALARNPMERRFFDQRLCACERNP